VARLVAVLDHLDPAGLAAPPDQHLRLDDARIADLVGGGERLADAGGGLTVGHRHAVAGEQLLALILEQVHERRRTLSEGHRTAVEIAKRIGWPLEPSRSGFLPDSVQRWAPFKETNAQLRKFVSNFETGLLSNIDDKLLGQTRRHIPHDFDLVVTAQQVRSYKPDPAHFVECARRIGTKKGWVHVAASYYHDVEPCLKQKVPVIWVNRNKEPLESGQKKPDTEVSSLREAAKLIGLS